MNARWLGKILDIFTGTCPILIFILLYIEKQNVSEQFQRSGNEQDKADVSYKQLWKPIIVNLEDMPELAQKLMETCLVRFDSRLYVIQNFKFNANLFGL